MLEAEPTSGQDPGDARLRESLRAVALAALDAADSGPADIRLRLLGRRAELALADGTVPEVAAPGVTASATAVVRAAARFIDELRGALRELGADRPAAAPRIRAAVELRSADGRRPGWDEAPVATARELAGAAVIRRVLAADPRSPVAVIASETWHRAALDAGQASADEYCQVQVATDGYQGSAWVKVPGRTWPGGLTQADLPPGEATRSASATSRAADRAAGQTTNAVEGGEIGVLIQSGVITGDVNIGNRYSAGGPRGSRP